MTVDLSSSNPEPTNFLMGTIANELDLISQTLLTSSPASTLKGKEFSLKSLSIFQMTTFSYF